MIAAYRAIRDLPTQFRAGMNTVLTRVDALTQEVRNMSKGLDALKAADAALAAEVQSATTALKADADKLAAAMAARAEDAELDNDDEVLAAATSIQQKVDALHAQFTPAS